MISSDREWKCEQLHGQNKSKYAGKMWCFNETQPVESSKIGMSTHNGYAACRIGRAV